ncbi:MAG: SDR family oxidoreductase [Clostridia bacterium]|nr:SDR family oxidoreductase [Clostridia bacterium]
MFQNKTVFITGGGSGIGLLSGKCFAKEGANVALVDINQAALDAAVAEITAAGGKAIGIKTDVTKYEEVVAAKDRAVEEFGSIDIVLPCAGGAEARMLNDHTEWKDQDISVFEFGIDLNLKGAVYAAKAGLQQMAKQKSGVIIFLGSITGVEGSEHSVAYAAAKSALMNGVTKSLAQYGAQYNVRVTYVAPGPVMTREAMAKMATLMGRAAETQEIVDMIMYLASDKAAFITGSGLLMDGGRNVMPKKGYEELKK